MRRRAAAILPALALLALSACASTGSGAHIEPDARTEARARQLATVTGPTGWTAQDNRIRATNQARFDLGGVPVTLDTDGGVSLGFVSPELDEPASYRTGCEAAAEYFGRVRAAVAGDAPAASFAFPVDDCVAALTRTTAEDGSPIGEGQSVALWTDGAKGPGTERYLAGVLRLGGAGEDPRQLNAVVGWTPVGA